MLITDVWNNYVVMATYKGMYTIYVLTLIYTDDRTNVALTLNYNHSNDYTLSYDSVTYGVEASIFYKDLVV